ncbi:MAG: methyltransferase domain-containing protein [Anaerolineae bacterium]|nr:methyltransferase domain-containing protein [Anaerolineae bacterium]
MPREWIDVSHLSFNTLLLLEQIQLSWLPGWLPEQELGLALKANPVVEWYMRHKCPQLNEWLDRVMAAVQGNKGGGPKEVRQAEMSVLATMTDLVVYAVDPAVYDAQPFLGWDTDELLSVTDFSGKTVIDVGAGTGRLALAVAGQARTVFAVEPVANLRAYLKKKARAKGLHNVYPVDGLITDIPFPEQTADTTMGSHVFGDDLDAEYQEMVRVTKVGGLIILCPGNDDKDNETHGFLVARGFDWSRFEEPRDGWKRKYWKRIA